MKAANMFAVLCMVFTFVSGASAQGLSAGAQHRAYPQYEKSIKAGLEQARETCGRKLGLEDAHQAELLPKDSAAAAAYNDCIADILYPPSKN
jgi:hypothetical protein